MKNRELYAVEEAQHQKMVELDETLLRSTNTAKQAMLLMISHANTTQEAIADDLNTTQYSISRMANGNRGININELEALINSCGNLFLLQYLANRFGKRLIDIDEKEAHIKDLEYQLEQARRA